MNIRSLEDWSQILFDSWSNLTTRVKPAGIDRSYERLVVQSFLPIFDSQDLSEILNFIANEPYGAALAQSIWDLVQSVRGEPDSVKLSSALYRSVCRHDEERVGVDFLLTSARVLVAAQHNMAEQELADFCTGLVEDIGELGKSPSLRVQAEILLGSRKLYIRKIDEDVHYTNTPESARNEIKEYLTKIRQTLDRVSIEQILPGTEAEISLGDLYIEPDVWDIRKTAGAIEQLIGSSDEDPDSRLDRRGVIEVASANPLLVLVGGPGSGKSTFARHLAMQLAQVEDSSKARELATQSIETAWIHGRVLPLHVELQSFSDSDEFLSSDDPFDPECLLRYLKRTLPAFGEHLDAYLNKTDVVGYTALLILDGLDEVRQIGATRVRIKNIIESWANRYEKCRVLVTSRPSAYMADAKWRLSDRFNVANLATFSLDQAREYVRKWYFITLLKERAILGGVREIEKRAMQLAGDFLNAVDRLPHLRPLIRTPLLLTLLTLIHASGKGRFPEGGRAGLYEETVKLLNRWDPPYEKPALIEKVEGLNLVRLREALQVLAYEVHRDQVSHRGTANIGRAKLLQVIDDYQSGGEIFVSQLGAPSDAIVEYLESRNGILLANSHEFFRFPHRSFQEFMAACALWENYDKCVLPNSATKVHVEEWTFPENIVVLLRSDFERWREVALLIGARLVAQRSFDQWWRLIDQLLPSHAANYADVTSAALDDNNWRCLLLSGEIWLEHKLEPKVVSQRTILNSLKESINVLIKNVVLTPVERNRAAEVLAVLGDDRSGVGLDSNGVPDVRLVDIPPGSFWMGSNRSPEEQPPHQVIVPHGFRISSYPVTNLQFEAFLKAKDGYCQTQWWDFSESARIWRRQVGSKQPVHSDLVALQNHPRVNVTWHEAVAFCRWLSNHTGLNFRLPTESEWEYVARGNDQREYPWGNVFDVNRCNMRETGIGTTSAVGIFGDSNYAFKEVYDLSGNVEEWCLTSWTEIGAYPYISGDGRNLLTEATPRVLRGGSFLSRKERVTTTARPGGAIDSQSKYIGFRVVVSGKAIERTGMNL